VNPKSLALSAFLALTTAALSQTTTPITPWTVADVYKAAANVGGTLNGAEWTPDSRRLTFLASDNQFGGEPGDLMAYDTATGQTYVLIPHTKLTALLSPPSNEKDKDHRARYGAPSYIWGPDSKHLLFDTDGQLTVVDEKNGTGVHVATSGAGSGDDPQFSPDGHYLAYIRSHNLYLAALHGGPETALTNTGNDKVLNGEVDWVYLEELDVRSNYFWSPDSKRIAYLQTNEEEVPAYPLIDFIPTHATIDAQRYPQAGDVNPTVRVGVTAPRNTKTVWLNIPLSAKNDYIPRFGWADANTVWVQVLKRDHKHKELWLADASNGSAHRILSESDEKFFDEHYDVKFLLPQSQFIWSSWRDGHTHLYLYSFDPHSNVEAKLVAQLTAGDFEVAGVSGINATQQRVFYTSNEGSPLEEHLWSVGLDGRNKRQLSAEPGVQGADFSKDGENYVEFSSSYTEPPSAQVCTGAGKCKPLIHGTVPQGHFFTAPVPIEGKASDGTTLYGQLLMPDTKTNASVPLIVNPYGGPHVETVRNAWGGANELFDQMLVERGFAVLHADNRGMGGRGAKFAYAAYHNFGPVQFEDQIAVLDQVLKQYPQLDAKRLSWWGWSWGGSFTLYAMTHSDRFKTGIAVAPVTDWRNYDSIYTERYMGTPSENPDGYKEDSVVNSAANLRGRLLIAQGTGDDNVHMANTIQFIQALIAADKPYDLQLYPRKTHSISGREARTHLFERILAQFETYLK
jgi:dipeptidyl-peptidase-4